MGVRSGPIFGLFIDRLGAGDCLRQTGTEALPGTWRQFGPPYGDCAAASFMMAASWVD